MEKANNNKQNPASIQGPSGAQGVDIPPLSSLQPENYATEPSGPQDLLTEDSALVLEPFDQEKTTVKDFADDVAFDEQERILDDSGTGVCLSDQTQQTACTSEAENLAENFEAKADPESTGSNPISGWAEPQLETQSIRGSLGEEDLQCIRDVSIDHAEATVSDFALKNSIAATLSDEYESLKNEDEIYLPGTEALAQSSASRASAINPMKEFMNQFNRPLRKESTISERKCATEDPAFYLNDNVNSSPNNAPKERVHFCTSSEICSIESNAVYVKEMKEVPDESLISTVSTGDFVVAINAGGSALLETSYGISFVEDSFFSGGDVLRTCDIIGETDDPSLYQTARYGNVAYTISDLPTKDYLVDLHFAEIIFTNGPPGMRVFDVYLQGNKVVSELDVYGRVGSNKPLVVSDLRTWVKDGTLKIRLEGVVGSPMINGLCVRIASPLDINGQSPSCDEENEVDEHIKECLEDVYEMEKGVQTCQQIQNKAQKGVLGYELKLQELRNECHEAWISVQESNRQAEKLRIELAFKSITVDTQANVIEGQMNEVKELKEKREEDRKALSSAIQNLWHKLQIMKEDHVLLANEAKICFGSLPDISAMTTSVQSIVDENKDLKRKYHTECQERRQLYNKVIDLKGNVRVFCRCRPLNTAEATAGTTTVTEFDAAKNDELAIETGNNSKKLFKFDRAFTPQDDQTEVFAETAPVVISVLDGYNVCIFAYGQTGTGKTFTMEGTPSNRGVNYRTLQELFRIVNERKGQVDYEILVSVLEVYNEQIRDLLNTSAISGPSLKKLEVKQVAEGGLHVPGLTEAKLHSMDEVWEVLQSGYSSRAVGSTNVNEHSSRSHCMLCVKVKGENVMTAECTRSKLWLVDLAGSERVAKSDVHGERLKEAQNINKSLSALGDVIHALTTKSSHIPYRNSKLTHLLQDSLGGESKTLMFLQISPSQTDMGETLCSLNFASRVRGVELGPARKQVESGELIKYKQMVDKVNKDVKSKDDLIKRLEENLRGCESKLKMKEHLCQTLVDKVRDRDKVTANLGVQFASEKNARIAAEAALKQIKTFPEIKVSTKEMSEIRADAEEFEKKALKTAGFVQAKDTTDTSQKPPLQEKLSDNGTKLSAKTEVPFIKNFDNQNENVDPRKGGSTDGAFSKKAPLTKAIPGPIRYNSPPMLRSISRRTGRASTCGVPRRMSFIPPTSLVMRTFPYATDTLMQNGIGLLKDNSLQIRKDQKTECLTKVNHPIQDPPPVVFGSTPVTWKAASHLPVRPGRRVQFRSPLLRRSREIKKDFKLKDLSPPLANIRLPKVSGLESVSKLRRVSICTSKPWSRQGSVVGVGGAQRVLSGNRQSSKVFLHRKERGWNKCQN